MAANYLREVVDAELKVIIPHNEHDAENVVLRTSRHHVKRDGLLGALDMGGSSTQIVYRSSAVPSGTSELSSADEHVPSHLNESDFFSTSFLSYGADQFRERLWNLWVSEAEAEAEDSSREPNTTTTISNPCNFAGYRMMYRGHEFVGSGNANSCKDQINRLIPHHQVAIDLEELYDEDEQSKTQTTVGSVELPPIRGKFYGMSLYFFTLDFLREVSDHGKCMKVGTSSEIILNGDLDSFAWQASNNPTIRPSHSRFLAHSKYRRNDPCAGLILPEELER